MAGINRIDEFSTYDLKTEEVNQFVDNILDLADLVITRGGEINKEGEGKHAKTTPLGSLFTNLMAYGGERYFDPASPLPYSSIKLVHGVLARGANPHQTTTFTVNRGSVMLSLNKGRQECSIYDYFVRDAVKNKVHPVLTQVIETTREGSKWESFSHKLKRAECSRTLANRVVTFEGLRLK